MAHPTPAEPTEPLAPAESARAPSFQIPTDDLIFSDLINRELRNRTTPEERTALSVGTVDTYRRWLAVLERFRSEVEEMLSARAAQMEALLRHASSETWGVEQAKYTKWQRNAIGFRNRVVRRAGRVRVWLRERRPEQVSPVELLRQGANLDPDDTKGLQHWQRTVRRWLGGQPDEEPLHVIDAETSGS